MKSETTPCPRCGLDSALFNYDEVDIGVGVQRFNESYSCPSCGEWASVGLGKVVFREDAPAPDPEEQRRADEFMAAELEKQGRS